MLEKHPKLLIIDDDPGSVGLLLAHLGDRELQIMVALGGEDGFTKALSGQPHLILLDLTMPGIDGFATCERLKSERRTAAIPVIFLTASTARDDKLRGFALGGVDYITKPFDEAEVLARVAVQLQVQRQLRRLEVLGTQHVLERRRPSADRESFMLQEAVCILNAQMTEAPNLPDLAHRVGTNERKLTELFRHRFGMTVFDYLSELRLDTGRRLLESTDTPVSLIAEAVGYQNPGDFARAFRRHYQVSPRNYRQACGHLDTENGRDAP
jgi:DNA-binding response OmpR family regulator